MLWLTLIYGVRVKTHGDIGSLSRNYRMSFYSDPKYTIIFTT